MSVRVNSNICLYQNYLVKIESSIIEMIFYVSAHHHDTMSVKVSTILCNDVKYVHNILILIKIKDGAMVMVVYEVHSIHSVGESVKLAVDVVDP